ncbi:hypothetical protein AAFF_G00339420 [Aldrovandia affinis]|uniref:TLC domain-containing protein n=1 Tax=Aldrovandia affinis TaxID=143900 RepID=A0AAD7SKC7_9TELE|nr:hypothetical protein AAFF_G00339420 [Aldrovandia affinis]
MEMREVTVVIGSFVGFQLLFSVASPLFSLAFTPGYSRLPPAKHTEWNSRLVSTVHALIVGLLCLYILWFDDAVNEDPVWGDPRLVKLNVAITCGYLLYDLVLLARNWGTMGDRFFVCHHLAALYAYGYVLTRGVLPYFANFRLISELSTPFVNQRWFFEALSYPRSERLVVVNGVAMAVVFFLVRIAVMPPYYARVVSTLARRPSSGWAWGRSPSGPHTPGAPRVAERPIRIPPAHTEVPSELSTCYNDWLSRGPVISEGGVCSDRGGQTRERVAPPVAPPPTTRVRSNHDPSRAYCDSVLAEQGSCESRAPPFSSKAANP